MPGAGIATDEEMTPAERKRLGRLGGMLMIVGSLAVVPAAAFLEPAPDSAEYLLAVAGVLAGVGLLAVPWERLPERVLYSVSILAMSYVVLGVLLYSDDFAFYQVLIGVYTAYAVRDSRDFVILMFFLSVATVAPLLLADESFNERAHHVLVTLPVLLIAASVVRYLRNALSEQELQYRRFAVEAVTLAERIRGGPPHPQEATAENVEERLAELTSKTRA